MSNSELRDLSKKELDQIPLIHMPHRTLFPGAILPLRIIAANDRALIIASLHHYKQAIALSSSLVQVNELPKIIGAGRIVSYENHGQFSDVIIQGICRVEIEELSDTDEKYQIASAHQLQEDETFVVDGALASLISSANSIAQVVRQKHPQFSIGIGKGESKSWIIDRIADRFITDPDSREKILEEINLKKRIELVTSLLSELLALLVSQTPGS